MANVNRSLKASIDATSAIQSGNKIPKLPGDPMRANQAIAAAAVPVRIDPTTGDMVPASGDSAPNARLIGFTGKGYVEDEPVTVFRQNSVFYYSDDFSADGVSPDDDLFLGTGGLLADTALANSGEPVARVLDNHHILITRAA
ncbi:hypothetical protein [Rubrivirga sp.]|uniref:hypothetical protein n=1 Tax=Rubrivirga sp. TaxID=1885344 RepID=UPI003C70B25D